MADVTANHDFVGTGVADMQFLARGIAQGGRQAARHARFAARRHAVPDRYFEQITAQNDRFSAIGDKTGLLHGPFISENLLNLSSEPTDGAEVPENALDGFMAARAPLDVSVSAANWSGGLVSLIMHSAMAALLLAVGMTVEIPAVEGETAVMVTIIGNAPENEMAAQSSPAAAEPETVTVAPPPPIQEQPVQAAKAEPEPSAPQQALIASSQPSSLATVLPQKLPEVVKPKITPPKPVEKSAPQKVSELQDLPKVPVKTSEPPRKQAPAKTEPKAEPKTEPKPAKAEPKKVPKDKAVKKASEKPEPHGKKTLEKPIAKPNNAIAIKSADAAGKGKTNAQKGAADGVQKGQTKAKSAGNTLGKTGDAAASNYAGLVQRKIARTRQRPAGGHGNVIVSFTISSSGGITSASISQSSGTPAVDTAALDHVRRSAPFPAPPAGAQTHFQIPITIR